MKPTSFKSWRWQRWITISISSIAVILAAAFGILYLIFAPFRPSNVLEIELADVQFIFWVQPRAWDYGDPSLVLEIRNPNGIGLEHGWVDLGVVRDWFETENIDLSVVEYDSVMGVIVGAEASKPLFLWNPTTGDHFPRAIGEFGNSDYTEWPAIRERLLNELPKEILGEEPCFGYLDRSVRCRLFEPGTRSMLSAKNL